mmetsp:Transcript_6577/g.12773  ORF Transcript_6577/g.12773 Transcript_6577/m.12773 type:complete len:472 (-) Transcript_6577:7-1422(-)
MLLVLGVGDQPVDRGEMLTLRKLLVQPPEHLHDRERRGAHGIGEVTTSGRHGTDDGDGAVALGVAEAGNLARTLVEGRKTGREVRGVALVGRHLSETSGNLTKSLGPAGGGVRHHGHVHAHVAEVLGKGDTRVDGRLTGRHRHVGGVGDEGGALHDGVRLAVLDHSELGEVHENLSHLVSALPASDIDDGLRVGVLGQRLRDNRLAAPERAGHRAGPAEHRGEEGVEHALPREEGIVTRELLRDGAGGAHRPVLEHSEALALAVDVLDLDHVVGERVLTDRRHPGDAARLAGEEHDGVVDELVLLHHTEDVAARHNGADGELARGVVHPPLLHVQRLHVDTPGNKDGASLLHDNLKGALNSVKDLSHDTGSKGHGQRLVGALHRVPDGQAGGLLVHLDGGRLAIKTDDLSDQTKVTDTNKLVHSRSRHLLSHHNGAGHGVDISVRFLRHDCLISPPRGEKDAPRMMIFGPR